MCWVGAGLPVAHKLEYALESLAGELAQRVEGLFRERLVFGRSLKLHVPSVVRHDDIQVHLCRGVVDIVEVQVGLAVAHPDRHCRDAVDDGVNGFLIPIRDSESLACKLRTLIEDKALREKMGRASRAKAEREFDLKKVVERHLEIYEKVRQL